RPLARGRGRAGAARARAAGDRVAAAALTASARAPLPLLLRRDEPRVRPLRGVRPLARGPRLARPALPGGPGASRRAAGARFALTDRGRRARRPRALACVGAAAGRPPRGSAAARARPRTWLQLHPR